MHCLQMLVPQQLSPFNICKEGAQMSLKHCSTKANPWKHSNGYSGGRIFSLHLPLHSCLVTESGVSVSGQLFSLSELPADEEC